MLEENTKAYSNILHTEFSSCEPLFETRTFLLLKLEYFSSLRGSVNNNGNEPPLAFAISAQTILAAIYITSNVL